MTNSNGNSPAWLSDLPSDFWRGGQWPCIQQNLGEWRGAFVQFSATAERQTVTPSRLTLTEDRPTEHMTLVLERTPPGQATQTTVRELAYPGAAPYICFFPTGAFSQGAQQRRPWSSFGAEFCLLSGQRRLRLVQLYTGDAAGRHRLDYVTLIHEERSPAAAPVIPEERLGVESLVGTWQGHGLLLPATMEAPQVVPSCCQIRLQNGRLEQRQPDRGAVSRYVSSADGYRWQAESHSQQLWLLPQATCTAYPQLEKEETVCLELCWYLSSSQRQRLVRTYGKDGGWQTVALFTESRIRSHF